MRAFAFVLCLLVMPVAARGSGWDTRWQAERQVIEATRQVRQMKSDPQVRKLLSEAKGVFIGSGAGGVFLEKHGGSWDDPLFYEVGSMGARRIALMLMSEQAVDDFRQGNNLYLSAGEVLWSATTGPFAAAGKAMSGIRFEPDATRAYYSRDAGAAAGATDSVHPPDTARALREALSN